MMGSDAPSGARHKPSVPRRSWMLRARKGASAAAVGGVDRDDAKLHVRGGCEGGAGDRRSSGADEHTPPTTKSRLYSPTDTYGRRQRLDRQFAIKSACRLRAGER